MLVRYGALTRGCADDLLAQAFEHAPSDVIVGFVHRDFCPENLVLWGGTIHSIDNAMLSVDACDEDLARTVYRWPHSESLPAFLDAYGHYRKYDSFVAHFEFWAMLVLSKAAEFRLRSGTPGVGRLVRLLTQRLPRRNGMLARDEAF